MGLGFISLSFLIISVTCFVLGLLIIGFGKEKIHKLWSLFNISLAVWAFACFVGTISKESRIALIWWTIGQLSGIWCTAFFFHVVCILCGIDRKFVLTIGYANAAIFDILGLTNNLGLDIQYLFGSIYYLKSTNYVFPTLIIIWIAVAAYGHYELFRHYNRLSDAKRKVQFRFLIVGMITGYVGGGLNFLPMFGLHMYPWTIIGIAIYCVIATYAIFRHQMLNIEIMIRKTLVFTGLLASVLIMLILPTLLLQDYILRSASFSAKLAGFAISGVVIIISIRRIEDFLIKITDKYLFQKKYDYQQIIRSFIENVITVPDADKIVVATAALVGDTLRPEKMAMFLFDKKIRKFVSRNNIGYDEHLDLDKMPNILSYLSTARNILSIEHENNKGVANAIIDEMKLIGIHIAIPLISLNELLGIIFLGKKKSDELYTTEDLNALMDLAKTEAIAIKNSMVIQELTEEKKIAALGKVASSLSHNINNHLNRARVRIQEAIYTEEILDKLKKADNTEEREKLVERLSEHLNRAIDYIDAGADVVKKARDFASPTKGPPSSVDIKTPLEKAIFMVKELKFKEGTRQISIAVDIAQDVPKVKAKEDDLREVIITVLDNAVDSIRMKELKGLSDTADNILVKAVYIKKLKEVELRIIDTGVGIKKEDLEDIFLRYFTTKGSAALYEDYARRKDVRIKSEKNNGVYGTGLGLDLVKSLVEEQIKGTLRAESDGENKGATFIITIPEWLEEKDGKSISS